jgi:hypothetical protein
MMEHSENSWLELFDPLFSAFRNDDNLEEVIVFWTFFIATVILFIGNTKFGYKK